MQDDNQFPSDAGDKLPAPASDALQHALAPRPGGQAISLDLRQAEPQAAEDEIDLLEYWRVLVKRKWTVLGALGIVLAITLVGTLLMTPVYRATTLLQIERDTINVVNLQSVTPTESAADKDFYQTQFELLQSRTLAQRVISQLNLAQGPVFERMRSPSAIGKLLALLRGGGEEATDEAAIAAEDSGNATAFLARLSIEPVRNSRLVRVNFDSPEPAFSAKVVNAVAEAFIASNLERRFDASSYAKDYLEDRLEQLKLKLEDSEKQLVAFAQKEQIVNIDDRQSLSGQNLGEINAALAKAQDERFRAEAKWRQSQAASGMGLPDVLGSELIQNLQKTRATLKGEYQQKLSLYKPDYPLMQQLGSQIDEIDKQIAAEVANIKASVQAQYLAAKGQEDLLRERIGELKIAELDLQDRSIQYNTLKREVETNRQLYDGLLQRYKEIGVAGGVGTNNISVVDSAEVPTGKHSPRLALNLAVGLLLGLFGGMLLALLMERLDDTLKVPEDLEKQLGLAVLGIIPKLKGMTPAVALDDPRSAFAEAYRSVRTALQFSTESGVPKTLLITSATPSEGKSTSALTLARNFAQLGKRVLLIDADLRNASLHKLLGQDNSRGLSNHLAGAIKAPEAILPTDERNLWVMLTGPLPPNPAELLASGRMMSLLTVAAEKFDQIVIDGPPVMGIADAPILANMSHGTLLVVEAGQTRLGVARVAVKRLLGARARLIGAVLTKYDAKITGYGYGDYGYYAYGATTPKLTRQ